MRCDNNAAVTNLSWHLTVSDVEAVNVVNVIIDVIIELNRFIVFVEI